jgi:hypothetical protein
MWSRFKTSENYGFRSEDQSSDRRLRQNPTAREVEVAKKPKRKSAYELHSKTANLLRILRKGEAYMNDSAIFVSKGGFFRSINQKSTS